MVSLDPRTWPREEVEHYMQRGTELHDLKPAAAEGARACLVGSTGPFAQLAGRKALQAGGTAMDAAIATALTQVALAAGCWVSYGGLFSAVYYDASGGGVSSLNAGFRTFLQETDPLTIPRWPEPSGRTAMTPGFFAGVQAAHDRFGRLAWADLFAPAIYVAEEGFVVGATQAAHFKLREDVLHRTPEGRKTFGDPLPQAGDVVRQPQLAATLRAVAEQGAAFIYRGPWAERFVEVVRREGGKATLADLAGYTVGWTEPLRTTFGRYEVAALGAPDTGGAALCEGLNLAELAGIGDPTTDAESLYRLIQISRQGHALTLLPPATRASKEHAERLWKEMQNAGRVVGPRLFLSGTHSDFVAACDEEGNVVAVCHSINTGLWGATGIFVDGISIPDSAAFQQQLLATVGPGAHLPNPTNPAIVLCDGAPILASSSIGSGLHEVTLQCLTAVLGRGVEPAKAVLGPFFHAPNYIAGDSINSEVRRDATVESDRIHTDAVREGLEGLEALLRAEQEAGTDPLDIFSNILAKVGQTVAEGFPDEVLEGVRARGVDVAVYPEGDPLIPRGYWGGLKVEPGRLQGARTSFCNGTVEAY